MIPIRTEKEIAIMREGGKKLSMIMTILEKAVAVGVNTFDLDAIAEKAIRENGGTPSFKGYGAEYSKPFPASICASLNDEVVHGIPSKKVILKDGDVLKIDVGMKYRGFHTDMARTFVVGKSDKKRREIADVAKESFYAGVHAMKPGGTMCDYSSAVQKYVESKGFSVVRDLVGHGIGRRLHEDPQIPNYFSKRLCNFILKPGMVFALEPMINEKSYGIDLGDDEWVYRSDDGGMSAHWENTVVVTENGVEILTEN